ncbi:MAG: AAA family ATPase, partial [Planctomycetota bacterium]
MLRRNLEPQLKAALADTPVVLVHGARQTGKTTLTQSLTATKPPRRYLTLDDATTLAAATSDPAGFLSALDGPIIIDEVQRAPALFPAIKAAVDKDRKPGRFLLTGSANVLLLPKVSESLAGRIEIITLWPLSQGEIQGRSERFIDSDFAAKLPTSHTDNSGPS